MKQKLNSQKSSSMMFLLFAAVLAGFVSLGALNGGTAVTASTWDSVVTYLQGMLSSTWVLVLAFVVLIIAVWQLAHGGGYRTIGLILGVLAVALIGPGVVRGVATSVGEAAGIDHVPSAFIKQAK